MAFKGTWHRAEGGGGNPSNNDRRYGSSNDSYSSSYGLHSQGVGTHQMNLSGMNYPNNPNAMYSGSTLMPSGNFSAANKETPYKGTVSNIYRDFGVIDNEISFKLNAVSGPMPRVGDRVICQMKSAEGFAGQTPYKYSGFNVRILQSPGENRRAPRPSIGSQPMSRNSDSFSNRNQNRNPPSNVKRPGPVNNQPSSFGSNHRDRQQSLDKNGNNDRHRPSPARRNDLRTNKNLPAKRNSRPPTNKYLCTLPKGNLECSELNVVQIRSRYPRLHIPSDFYHASYTWHQSIPLDSPLKFVTPCSFHLFQKPMPHISDKSEPVVEPTDGDYRWNVRVILMSSPDIQTLISRSCLLNCDPNKKNSIDPDDFEHPSKLIKFLVGLKNHNEYFPLGGCWSQSLDGPNPDTDPQVLIRTAIRCVRSQTGIDLSKCIQWCRYLEVRYHRPEEIHKGRLIESRVENVVVFLPDIAVSCMPTSLEWEETVGKYKQACEQELAEELNEVTLSDDGLQGSTATHYSAMDLDHLRLIDLQRELKLREQPVTGIKSDLKKRLAKIIEQEKLNAEKEKTASEQTNDAETVETPNPPITVDVKDSSPADIDKLRKEIQSKYQIPSQRSILVHVTPSRADKFDCRVVSLNYLLNYANKDTIKEKCFELYLFAEAFTEMLQRDHIYLIYRSLFSCLEVTETNVESTVNEPVAPETEETESMSTANNDETSLPKAEETIESEENGKKRKRSASKDEDPTQRKKANPEENRWRTIHPELLLAFTFFDRNRCGYLVEKDLEEILLLSGLSLTKNETKLLVNRIAQDEKVRYHQLTDKILPADETDEIPLKEMEIDAQAPKGNLLLLPSHLSTFGVRSADQKFNGEFNHAVDQQRAIKQLEISSQIQTSLELKIDALKKEIQNLNEELSSTQKSSRSYSDQLNETKKRLRDTQHDLKELEEKSERYSEVLRRLRNESRSTFDHLSHVLGIKEKPAKKKKENDNDANETENNEKSDEVLPTTEKPIAEE